MSVNWSSPQDVQQFRQTAIQRGADPREADQYISSQVTNSLMQTPQEPVQEPKSVSGFIGNIGKSAVNTVGGIANSLLHPIQTVKDIGNTGLGAIELALPGEQSHEKYAKAVGSMLKDRYGSLDNIGNTLYNDPVGAALDASMLLDFGGSALGKIGDVSKVSEIANAGKKAAEIGKAVDPFRAVGKVVGGVTSKIDGGRIGEAITKAGEKYALQGVGQPAAVENFSKRYGPLEDFMGKHGISGPDPGKLEDVISKAQPAFDAIAKKSDRVVNMSPVYQNVQSMIDQIKNSPVQGVAENADALQSTLDHLQSVAGDAMPIRDATEARIAFDKLVKDFKTDPAKMGVNQVMRNALQDAIQQAAAGLVDSKGQDLAAQGAELSKMYAAQPILERAAARGSLKTPFGLGKMAAGTAGGLMGGVPGAIAGYGLETLASSPKGVGAISKGIKGVGSFISDLPKNISNITGRAVPVAGNLGNVGTALGVLPSRLLPITQNAVNDANGNGNNSSQETSQNLQNGLSGSAKYSEPGQSISQGSMSLGDTPPQLGDSSGNVSGLPSTPPTSPQYANQWGKSPAELLAASQRAKSAGNIKASNNLRQAALDEITYQKTVSSGGPKPLSSTGATAITDLQTSMHLLDELGGTGEFKGAGLLDKYKNIMGPFNGRLQSMNMYNTQAQVFQSEMGQIAQVIGKAMEGGVLRKEDEVKYQKMLPQMSDTYAVAQGKLAAVKSLLNARYKFANQNYRGTSDITLPANPADALQ